MVAKTSLIAFRGVGGRFNLKKNKTKQKNVATVPAVPPTLWESLHNGTVKDTCEAALRFGYDELT